MFFRATKNKMLLPPVVVARVSGAIMLTAYNNNCTAVVFAVRTSGFFSMRAGGLSHPGFESGTSGGGNKHKTHLSNSSAMPSAALGYSMKRSSSACDCVKAELFATTLLPLSPGESRPALAGRVGRKKLRVLLPKLSCRNK